MDLQRGPKMTILQKQIPKNDKKAKNKDPQMTKKKQKMTENNKCRDRTPGT